MQIQNNIASVNSSRNQKIIKGKLDKSLEKLSSGFRINRAGDDAAGLAISELMRSQIRGLDQAMRNVNDGVSMTNTGEGALTEIHSMLQRMKTLAVQSANGTYSSVARENIESERLQLLDEIDRISQTTVDNANQAVDTIEDAIEAVADVRASFGASLNHLEHTSSNLGVTKENMTVAESRIRDTDMAEQITAYTTENIILQSSNSMMVHANSLPDLVIQLLQG